MQGDDYNVGKIYFGIKIPRGTEFVKNEHPLTHFHTPKRL